MACGRRARSHDLPVNVREQSPFRYRSCPDTYIQKAGNAEVAIVGSERGGRGARLEDGSRAPKRYTGTTARRIVCQGGEGWGGRGVVAGGGAGEVGSWTAPAYSNYLASSGAMRPFFAGFSNRYSLNICPMLMPESRQLFLTAPAVPVVHLPRS